MPTNCTNCFNNCTDIQSDKCVKYTGIDIPFLEISNGDTLYSVEDKLITFLISALDGTGINITIDPLDLCDLVTGYLGAGTTLVDIITALVKSICDLQGQVTTVTANVDELNSDYVVDCLGGVVASDNTHDIVQAIITKLCTVVTDVEVLATDLATNYVALSDLNDLIQAYLDGISAGAAMKDKMIPYTAVEYYGPLTYFDLTGAGTGDWDRIFLCNGNNGTPDKRGRVAVGTTTGMGGGAFDPEVDPAISPNPTYELYDTNGANVVTLSEAQMPSHSHATDVTLTDPGHFHYEFADSSTDGTLTSSVFPNNLKTSGTDSEYNIQGNSTIATIGKSSTTTTGITKTMTNPDAGSDEAHNNIQPVLACHYIIMIP